MDMPYCGSCLIALFLGSFMPVVLGTLEAANERVINVKVGSRGQVMSQDFFGSCCDNERITIQCEQAGQDTRPTRDGCYIHLVFDDLDLPQDASFQIYEDNTEAVLSPDQPSYRYGTWTRPFVSSVSLIKLVLTTQPAASYNKSDYAGFKAVYHTTTDPTPYHRLTSDLCGHLSSVAEGGFLRVKPQPAAKFRDTALDCVWVLKPLAYSLRTQFDRVRYQNTSVYVRVDTANIQGVGNLEIRQGTHSLCPLLASGTALSLLSQPEQGYVSNDGLYLRALLSADDRRNIITFTYGYVILLDKDTTQSCPADYYRCFEPHDRWCIPLAHVCNNAQNCPNGEDENECDGVGNAPSPAGDVTMVTPDANSSSTDHRCVNELCSDGRCVSYRFHCHDPNIARSPCPITDRYCEGTDSCVLWVNKCPGECESYEKRCEDESCVSSSHFCPEEPCPSILPNRCANNEECFSVADHCDDTVDCSDESDEQDCPWYKKLLRGQYMLFGLLALCAVMTLIVAMCYRYCRASCPELFQSSGIRVPTSNAATGTRLQVIQRETPNPPANQDLPGSDYVAIPTTNPYTTEPHTDIHGVHPLAPPAYDDIVNTESMERAIPERPPPYESSLNGPQTEPV